MDQVWRWDRQGELFHPAASSERLNSTFRVKLLHRPGVVAELAEDVVRVLAEQGRGIAHLERLIGEPIGEPGGIETARLGMLEVLAQTKNGVHVYWKALPLPPGRYKVEIAIKDDNNKDHVGTWKRSWEVP